MKEVHHEQQKHQDACRFGNWSRRTGFTRSRGSANNNRFFRRNCRHRAEGARASRGHLADRERQWKKVLAVDGRQWKEGQSSAGIADKARALYGERYAE